MYPVAFKRNFKVFDSKSAKERIENEALKSELDKYRFTSGNCYYNANTVCYIGREVGIDVEFWAGWLCIGYYPVYHAWNVWDDNIIVVSFSFYESALISQANEENGGKAPREYIAAKLLGAEKTYPVTTTHSVFGQIPTAQSDNKVIKYAMTHLKGVSLRWFAR